MNYIITHSLLKTSSVAKAILGLLILVLTFEFVYIENSLAGTGNTLVISGSIVNVRTAPTTDSEAPIRLRRGHQVVEIQRQGEWVEVETGHVNTKTGWIHESLISTTPATRAPVQQGARSSNVLFNNFMQIFEARKESIKNQDDALYFVNARLKGEATVVVIATEAWLVSDIKERQDALSKVLDIWSEVNPETTSITVRVYDLYGEQHMMMMLH